MISLVQSIPAGNAVRVLLNPPFTADYWRLTRNGTGVFADEDDGVVYEGRDLAVIDIAALPNGAAVYYKPWYFDGAAWDGTADSKAVTPAASFVDRSVSPLALLRDRLDAGLNALLARGELAHPNGAIPVMTAYPQIDSAPFPLVTVHLQSTQSEQHFISDMVADDWAAIGGGADQFAGWYSRWQIEVAAWSLNGDERQALRQASKAVIIANLEVFDSQGLIEVDMSFSDVEDFQQYNAPVYESVGTFRCLAPSAVSAHSSSAVSSVTVSPSFIP